MGPDYLNSAENAGKK